ncbi:MAG: metallophosphoesterase [Sulfolobales archaeon]|nr:metallophosphoesterase [Sulfolobales archaeon]MCX8186511.1 metallophosphoesterase [Sulfolobales archaeon]MDW7969059.1 metallophosphoesterase [Sulfolobales archaeon]
MGFELISGVEVVNELPVIYIRKYRMALLADTHIGFEEEMAEKGIYIPRFQKKKLMNILEEVFNTIDVDSLIIVGDFKHKFDGLGRIERIELNEVIKYAVSRVSKFVVIRGNHDNYLSILTRKYSFEFVDKLSFDSFLIMHGHYELSDALSNKLIIIGHEHPVITIRDSLGSIGRFQCFLIGETTYGSQLITLPAVGAYQTGSKVTLDRSTYLSPILRDAAVLEGLRPVIIDDEVGVLELPSLKDLYDLLWL